MSMSMSIPNKYCQTEFLLLSSVRVCMNLCSNCMWFQGWLCFIKAYFIKGFGTQTRYESMVLVGSDIHTKRRFWSGQFQSATPGHQHVSKQALAAWERKATGITLSACPQEMLPCCALPHSSLWLENN